MRARQTIYEPTYDATRSRILASSGLPATALDNAAFELQVDYEIFLMDYQGPVPLDPHVGFAQMLRAWGFPWADEQNDDFPSSLNGLTLAQYFLSWAWRENDVARFYLDGEAV